MKKYISTFTGHNNTSTARAAQQMTATLAKSEGYEEIKIHPHQRGKEGDEATLKRVSYALESVDEGALFILQLPTWNVDLEYSALYLSELRKKVKYLIIFVHDFIPLMFENNLGYTEWFLAQYNQADLVVLPSLKMESWMRQFGLKASVLIQGIWDHYSTLDLSPPLSLSRSVKFPGSPEKFKIASQWSQEISLDIYCTDNQIEVPEHVTLHPFLSDDALLLELNKGGFGLVWAENTENMPTKDYSTMCHSYKLSTYLAAGIPLLVQGGMTASDFVKQNGVGFVVDSLEEAAQKVRDISDEDYKAMQERVVPIAQMVREGFFFKKLLLEIEENLFLNKEMRKYDVL